MTDCVANVYTSAAAAKAALEALDDTKFLGIVSVKEENMPKIIVVHKV